MSRVQQGVVDPSEEGKVAGTTFQHALREDLAPRYSIFCCRWLPTQGGPTAALVFVHGVHEHCLRYSRLVSAMSAKGVAVFSFDHVGHGRSSGTRGHVKKASLLTETAVKYVKDIHSEFPNIPMFLFGHSMGAAVATLAAKKLTDLPLSGLLLCGTPAMKDQKMLRYVAGVVGTIAPKSKGKALDMDNLSRDPHVKEAYCEDVLCIKKPMKMRFCHELLCMTAEVYRSGPALSVPLIMTHGSADKICNPDGARVVFDTAASADKTWNLVEGAFHEVLNEENGEDTARTLAQWVQSHVGPQLQQ